MFEKRKRKKQIIISTAKEDYNKLQSYFNDKLIEQTAFARKWEEKNNASCPKCNSKNIVNKIAQVEGTSSGTSSIFGGYSSSSIDTYPVNHCNDCGNEWIRKKVTISSVENNMENLLLGILYNMEKYNKIMHGPYNKNDLKEKFNSKEEKINSLSQDLAKAIDERDYLEAAQKIHIESLPYLVEEILDSEYSNYHETWLKEQWNEEFLEKYYHLKHTNLNENTISN